MWRLESVVAAFHKGGVRCFQVELKHAWSIVDRVLFIHLDFEKFCSCLQLVAAGAYLPEHNAAAASKGRFAATHILCSASLAEYAASV